MPLQADLQSRFAAYLTSPPGEEACDEIVRLVGSTGAPPHARLGIYKNNVYSRLVDALAATYPAVLGRAGNLADPAAGGIDQGETQIQRLRWRLQAETL